MKKPRFAIIGARKSLNTRDLVEEIEKKGFECELMHQKEMFFKVDENGKFVVEHKNLNLDDFDIFVFRTYSKYLNDSLILAEKLVQSGKVVIDNVLGKSFVLSKMFEASRLAQNNILYPVTVRCVDFGQSGDKVAKMLFPVIVKPVNGKQGRDVTKINNFEDICSFFKEKKGEWMIQEYVPIDYDIRVIVIGGKAIGAMKRYLVEGDFRSNIALGARSEKIDMDDDLKRLAERAASALEYDLAGVDIIESKRGLMVLEVNSSPQWQGFKKTTNINPAEEIIEYALEKYNLGLNE